MKIVTVLPLKKGMFRENLTYFTTKEIENGSIVNIAIRDKKILGLVIAIKEVSDNKSDIKNLDFNLKKIIEIKEKSIFGSVYLDSIFLIGKYFVAKNNNMITSLIPAIMKEEYDKISKFKTEIKKIENNNLKNIRAEKLLFQNKFTDRISYYKTLIRSSFAQKKSIYLVLPTAKDIEEFSQHLEKGIENFVITIHGGLSPKKQLKKIEQILTTNHPILVIGTAPYLAISRCDYETIILEHENSNAYKQVARPHVDQRVFVELFASKINAKLIVSDFLLRYETIARKEIDNFGEVYPLSYRTSFDGKITTTGYGDKFKVLTDVSINEIKNSLKKGENVFVFSLRKGLATITVCRDCHEPVMCNKCSAPLVLYLSRDGKKRMYSCNRCKEEKDPLTKCINCDSWNLMPLGIGTDTVMAELKKNFPKVNLFKLDKESAKTNAGAEQIIKEFEESNSSILVGTEMTFFYLKNKVPLSIIASFDSLWSIPNYKMSERIIQLIISMIRISERELIIQTKNEKDRAIVATVNENLLSFVREELNDRKQLQYPPYMRFIKIVHAGDKEKSNTIKETISELFKDYNPEIFSGFIAKNKDKYITNALIKIDIKKWSLTELSIGASLDQILLDKLYSLPPSFEVIIDPEDLL